MPRGSSPKRERQYEHIKDSAEQRGENTGRAEEIAARTVNKERARSGEAKTASRTSKQDMSSSRRGGLRSHSGSGGPTYEQLYSEARARPGYGTVTEDSPSWRAFNGQTMDEWLGSGWADAVHPEDRVYAQQQWQEAVDSRAPVNTRFRLWHTPSQTAGTADGERGGSGRMKRGYARAGDGGGADGLGEGRVDGGRKAAKGLVTISERDTNS